MRDPAHLAASMMAAPMTTEPFPHLVVPALCAADDAHALLAAVPAPEAFGTRGDKRDLVIREADEAFAALPPETQACWCYLRDTIRTVAAPILAARFADALADKYRWLCGDTMGATLMARGFTTTDGRLMARSEGYELRPHLDSAHFGVTCLLYWSSASTKDDGALGLYEPTRTPDVLEAGTYYPKPSEGIRAYRRKTIPVTPNTLIAFVNGPRSLHGYRCTTRAAWRVVYQCHLEPVGWSKSKILPHLDAAHAARWQRT